MSGIAKSLLNNTTKMYTFSNKTLRMLVPRINPRPFHSFPNFLLQPDGAPTHCPQSMVRVFGVFYIKLYNCLTPALHSPFNQEASDSFLADIHFVIC